MPRYLIHRIKHAPGESFRWASHTGGLAVVKSKDYEFVEEKDAENPYALWRIMRNSGMPLHIGDLLEIVPEQSDLAIRRLLVAKYVGFEPAEWFVAEPKSTNGAVSVESPALEQITRTS